MTGLQRKYIADVVIDAVAERLALSCTTISAVPGHLFLSVILRYYVS